MKETIDQNTTIVKEKENAFWRYSIAVYDRPGVSPLLLMCQNELDADVNMLLCCCWLGQQSKKLTVEQIADIESHIDEWREYCVRPLRRVRKFLKEQPELKRFRSDVKDLELEAEKRQQEMMYRYVQALNFAASHLDAAETQATKHNLAAYLGALPKYNVRQHSALLGDLLDVICLG